MAFHPSLSKDHIGCAVLVAMGAAAVLFGLDYQFGSLSHMGAGFIPVVLGALMLAVGIAVGVTASPRSTPAAGSGDGSHGGRGKPEWRGWSCIVGGIVAFVVLGQHGGLVPASFASIFISAMGDRDNTLRSAGVLAAVVTLFGTLVFFFGLHLQLPLFQWV
jgi:hypothetical protein